MFQFIIALVSILEIHLKVIYYFELKFQLSTVTNGNLILQSMLARNFYNFKLIALALAFLINFILLFYKVNEKVKSLNQLT